jgi:sec-independent protein translocase protein TatB
MGFGEMCVLLMVAMVVLGPKELPRYLRKAGQVAGRLRRLASEMREKSGIDEVLRSEGIHQEIAEIRRLARGEIVGVTSAMRSITDSARIGAEPTSPYTPPAPLDPLPVAALPVSIAREREYPWEGADSYGALPDTASVYDGALAASPLADDGLYARGEPQTEPPLSSTSPAADASTTTA